MNIIVQAGGRGSRLRHHTWNKPKCLVSVFGKPLLYHLFTTYPDAKYHIIGDYAFDALASYLKVNSPKIDYVLIRTREKGTASGINEALKMIDAESPVLLVWSDLILRGSPVWPKSENPVVCITSAFMCRWSATEQGELIEKPSSERGIPGIFYFPKASLIAEPPESGEFVRWFAETVKKFDLHEYSDIEELGEYSVIEENNDREGFSRFFNSVEIGSHEVTKRVIDSLYKDVHENEVAWYESAKLLGFKNIPKILSKNPFVMERIQGNHAYEMYDLSKREKLAVMVNYVETLAALHQSSSIKANESEIKEVYLSKTVSRVKSVSDLIPGFSQSSMTINGKKCRNIFSEKYEGIIEEVTKKLVPSNFVPIHGDPTFSNTLIDRKLQVWFIDPRGSFANPGIFGDAWYDFAKVYYSAVGNYDLFNRKKFKLHFDNETIEVLMEQSIFLEAAQEIFDDYFPKEKARIQVLHGLIWLSLSGYAKDDIDSVIASFYLGIYWLETGLSNI